MIVNDFSIPVPKNILSVSIIYRIQFISSLERIIFFLKGFDELSSEEFTLRFQRVYPFSDSCF